MKQSLLAILILISSQSFSQKAAKQSNGYAHIAMGGFLSNNYGNNIYPSMGVGVKNKSVSLGAAFYYHKNYNLSLHADLRALLAPNKNVTPFISIQPGASFYRKNTSAGSIKIQEKGGLALNILAGIMGGNKKPGPSPYISIGYGMININTTVASVTEGTKIDGLVMLFGIKF